MYKQFSDIWLKETEGTMQPKLSSHALAHMK